MRSTTLSKTGAGLYTLMSAARDWTSSLESAFVEPSIPDYFVTKAHYGAEIGAVAGAALAVDRASATIEDLLPGGNKIRGIAPLAAVTIGVGAALNYFGNYVGIEQGHGVWETTSQLMYHYLDSAMTLASGEKADMGYLTGAAITATSAIRAGYNMMRGIGRRAEENAKKRETQKLRK